MRAARTRRDDSGFTLVELLVAMSLVGVLVAVFMAAVTQMTRATVRVQNVTTSSDEARRVYERFERQFRSASEVNRPVRTGTTWYLEFRTSATGTTTAQCTQWRYLASAGQVQLRTWSDVSSPVAGAWVTVGSRVVNDPVTQPPFAFAPADLTYSRQRVTLDLRASSGVPGSARVSGLVVARNSSPNSVTNADGNGDGVSDNQVCQQAGRP
jgi:prepilin-type N-terminal cleavage/methylation domain-containing protein